MHHTEVNFYARETRYTAQQTHNLDKDTLSHRLQSALLYSFRDLTFLFCQALHMHGFARALPHGASNNRHQVQYGNWHFAIRREKKVQERLRLGPFFVLVSAWVSICARLGHSDPLLKGVQKSGVTQSFTATVWEMHIICFVCLFPVKLGI